jgi:hypothetical protein
MAIPVASVSLPLSRCDAAKLHRLSPTAFVLKYHGNIMEG